MRQLHNSSQPSRHDVSCATQVRARTAEMSACDATIAARVATTNIGQNRPLPPGSAFQNVLLCGCGSMLSGTPTM